MCLWLVDHRKKLFGIWVQKILKKRINKLEKDVEVLRRLYVVEDLYNGKKPEKICEKRGISLPTLHTWWDRWNEEGYDGLHPKYGNCGCHSKLSPEDKLKLSDILEKEDYLNQRKVAKIIKENFDVTYSLSHHKYYSKRAWISL